MATSSSRLFNLCSLLMSTLFAYSASVQLNDPGFWSLDLSERVVREKVGSIFVIISIFFQMEAASDVQKDISNVVKYGELYSLNPYWSTSSKPLNQLTLIPYVSLTCTQTNFLNDQRDTLRLEDKLEPQK
ncbi:hypothetical protein MTR_8g078730 [Medicago truncatula]|uniref:Transmembrane protein n=1 Tax=Medicago truncatula TaxID=3880 RepID=A0A072TUF4_MEDTR|nr:hypothetical protein MTR_8g078730 [Medicago truncatula]